MWGRGFNLRGGKNLGISCFIFKTGAWKLKGGSFGFPKGFRCCFLVFLLFKKIGEPSSGH